MASDAGTGGTSTVTVVNCTLNNNRADRTGGAIFNNGPGGHAVVTLINSTVSGNTATQSGGAIENVGESGSGIVTILNCTFNNKLAQRRQFDEIYVQPAAAYRR